MVICSTIRCFSTTQQLKASKASKLFLTYQHKSKINPATVFFSAMKQKIQISSYVFSIIADFMRWRDLFSRFALN